MITEIKISRVNVFWLKSRSAKDSSKDRGNLFENSISSITGSRTFQILVIRMKELVLQTGKKEDIEFKTFWENLFSNGKKEASIWISWQFVNILSMAVDSVDESKGKNHKTINRLKTLRAAIILML